jgi:hypothetical protein
MVLEWEIDKRNKWIYDMKPELFCRRRFVLEEW